MGVESDIRKLMKKGLSLQQAAHEVAIKERQKKMSVQTQMEQKPQQDSAGTSRPQWSFLDEGINPSQVKFDMATGRIMVRNKANTDAAEVQRLLWDDKRQNIVGYQRKDADPVYFKDIPKSAPKAPGRDPDSGPVAPSGVAYPQSTAASHVKIEAPKTDVQIMQRLSQKYPAYQTDAQQAQKYAKEYGEAHAQSENRQKIINAMPKVITEEYKAASKKLVNQYADYLDGRRKSKNGAERDDQVILLGLLEKSGYDANKFADMAVALGYKELDKNNDLQAILFGLAEGFNNAFVHWRQQIQTAGYNPHPYAQEIETIGKAQSESPFGSPDAVPILKEYSDSLGNLSKEKYAPAFRNIEAENQAMSDASHAMTQHASQFANEVKDYIAKPIGGMIPGFIATKALTAGIQGIAGLRAAAGYTGAGSTQLAPLGAVPDTAIGIPVAPPVPQNLGIAGVPVPIAEPGLPGPVANPQLPAPANVPGLPGPSANPQLPAPAQAPGLPEPVGNPQLPAPVQAPSLREPVANPQLPAPAQAPGLPGPVVNPQLPAQGQQEPTFHGPVLPYNFPAPKPVATIPVSPILPSAEGFSPAAPSAPVPNKSVLPYNTQTPQLPAPIQYVTNGNALSSVTDNPLLNALRRATNEQAGMGNPGFTSAPNEAGGNALGDKISPIGAMAFTDNGANGIMASDGNSMALAPNQTSGNPLLDALRQLAGNRTGNGDSAKQPATGGDGPPTDFDDPLDQRAVNEYLEAHKEIDLSYELVNKVIADNVNKYFKEKMGYEPPYKPGTLTYEVRLKENKKYVRVYDGINSKMYGGWIMEAEDVEGLTPLEIQNKFALPTTPKFICDVEIDAQKIIRFGEANPLFGFEGGGKQYDLMGQYAGKFSNQRLILGGNKIEK